MRRLDDLGPMHRGWVSLKNTVTVKFLAAMVVSGVAYFSRGIRMACNLTLSHGGKKIIVFYLHHIHAAKKRVSRDFNLY